MAEQKQPRKSRHDHIISVIAAIRNSFYGSVTVYTNGSCIMFYMILHEIWPEARPYWSMTNKHMITKIGALYYDINGIVDADSTYVLDESEWNTLEICKAFPESQKVPFCVPTLRKLY